MKVSCFTCGREFKKPLSHVLRVERVFCSKACHDEAQVKRVTVVCKICAKEFEVRPSEHVKFSTCSYPCYMKAKRGKHNGRWQGGISRLTYGGRRNAASGTARYKRFRKRILERDGNKCIDCGSTSDLELDHVKSWKDYPRLRYVENNVVTRCTECHRNRHRRKQ